MHRFLIIKNVTGSPASGSAGRHQGASSRPRPDWRRISLPGSGSGSGSAAGSALPVTAVEQQQLEEQQLQQQQQQQQSDPQREAAGVNQQQCSHCGGSSKKWIRHPTTRQSLCNACGQYAHRHGGTLPSKSRLERRQYQRSIKDEMAQQELHCSHCGGSSKNWRWHPTTHQRVCNGSWAFNRDGSLPSKSVLETRQKLGPPGTAEEIAQGRRCRCTEGSAPNDATSSGVRPEAVAGSCSIAASEGWQPLQSMGPRKGGGRSGFVKAARSAPSATESGDVVDAPEKTIAAPEKQAAVPSKAAAFLKDPEPADSGSSDEEGTMTRGKVLQRHKREQKALKEQAKRLGKKGKEEAARLEAEMAARHAAELAALDCAKERTVAEAVAVADSLYTVHLGPEGEDDGEQFHNKKQSKSQRRREQRQREEAEREARIAAELAEMGDSDRVIEERELKAVLQPLGLVIRPIPADGHCLYRSLEDQLQRLPEDLPAPPPAGAGTAEEEVEERSFLQLRQEAAAYMRAHADEFKPFVLQEDVSTSGGADDAFEAYCAELEGTAAWGGQVELQALAQVLQSHIVVYSVGLPVLEMGEEFKGTGRTLRLCYLRHAFGLGEHYESVVPGLAVPESEGEEEEGAEQQPAEGAAE